MAILAEVIFELGIPLCGSQPPSFVFERSTAGDLTAF
jgi:hypothetical protein